MKNKYVFISGLHRSGTTAFWKVLERNEHFSGFKNTGVPRDEGQHVQSVFNTARYYGGPGKFCFNEDSILDENSAILNKENNLKLHSEWNKHWNLEKEFLLEKSPPNLIRTRYLQEVFPNSYFLTIIRHPIATSYATQKWSKTHISSLIEHWIKAHDIYNSHKQSLVNHMEIRYEDFVANPADIMVKIEGFLGTNLLPADSVLRQGVNDKYFSWWNRYRFNIFGRPSYKSIVKKYESKVNEFGYSLIDLNL